VWIARNRAARLWRGALVYDRLLHAARAITVGYADITHACWVLVFVAQPLSCPNENELVCLAVREEARKLGDPRRALAEKPRAACGEVGIGNQSVEKAAPVDAFATESLTCVPLAFVREAPARQRSSHTRALAT
jgi:hypothetical protein